MKIDVEEGTLGMWLLPMPGTEKKAVAKPRPQEDKKYFQEFLLDQKKWWATINPTVPYDETVGWKKWRNEHLRKKFLRYKLSKLRKEAYAIEKELETTDLQQQTRKEAEQIEWRIATEAHTPADEKRLLAQLANLKISDMPDMTNKINQLRLIKEEIEEIHLLF